MTNGHHRNGRHLAPILVLVDAAIVYLAFVVGLAIRLGEWSLVPVMEGLWPAVAIMLVVYLSALIGSGIYQVQPSHMHLSRFLRVGVALLIAWAASVTLAFLIVPQNIPPRSVTVVHWMLSLIGILGLRAIIRYSYDRRYFQHLQPGLVHSYPPEMEELVQRPPVKINRAGLRDHLANRTVMVTGAGGSIGSELSRLLVDLGTFRLVMVDVSEYNLFQLESTLRGKPFSGELEFRIADVRDEQTMHILFSSFRPDIVLHAAAYKHVPLMERHPIEAFRNNTLATVGLLRQCEAHAVEQFLFISTDKAVEPVSVLGATKRLAEWYVQAAESKMLRKIVRFGNVLGTQGSVVPIFYDQILKGGPVTVTHPEMQRYFMSAPEACRLILQTILLDVAPVYMLRMEPPVKIQWLAEEMIKRFGKNLPYEVKVEHSGIRPGERLNEKLSNRNEQSLVTPHSEIVGLTSDFPYDRDLLDAYLEFLDSLARSNQQEVLRKYLLQEDLNEQTFVNKFKVAGLKSKSEA